MDQQNQQNKGFIPDKIQPEDFIFGGENLSAEVLQSEGQWDEFLPMKELQAKNGLETMACVIYGTLNCLETLFRKLTYIEDNFSERYIGILSETTHWGNSPQKVIQCIRHNGLIDEKLLPFDETIRTWAEYYAPKPMTDELIKKGKEWLEEYKVGHEWLSNRSPETLKRALKFSPLGISAYFSRQNEKGYFIKDKPDNHWIMLYGYVDGEYWKVFDHYNNIFKKVDWNYHFDFAKRYSLEKQLIKKSFFQKVWEFIKQLFKNYYV